jgi:hypothetical protein
MSLGPLIALVLDVVTRVGDDPLPVRTALARELATRPRMVLIAWEALRVQGAQPRWRDLAEMTWALEVVGTAVTALHLPASADSHAARPSDLPPRVLRGRSKRFWLAKSTAHATEFTVGGL